MWEKSKATFPLRRVPVLVPVWVIRTSEAHTSALVETETQSCTSNSVAIKNLVKIVKYVEFLENVYSAIAGNVVRITSKLQL